MWCYRRREVSQGRDQEGRIWILSRGGGGGGGGRGGGLSIYRVQGR